LRRKTQLLKRRIAYLRPAEQLKNLSRRELSGLQTYNYSNLYANLFCGLLVFFSSFLVCYFVSTHDYSTNCYDFSMKKFFFARPCFSLYSLVVERLRSGNARISTRYNEIFAWRIPRYSVFWRESHLK
jgi:hypothetical protein